MPSEEFQSEPVTLKAGDSVRLAVDVVVPPYPPRIMKGATGKVVAVNVAEMYPIEVMFDGAKETCPCWEDELERVDGPAPTAALRGSENEPEDESPDQCTP